MKTKVNLRVKTLKDGRGSYYLDWFQNGKRNYEYLQIYKYLSERLTKAQRDENTENERLAQHIRNQRENQLITSPQGILSVQKKKQSLLVFCETHTTTKGGEQVLAHLKNYMTNPNLQMQDVNKSFIQGFADHLAKKLNGNTAYDYFSKFRGLMKRAMAEGILPGNILLDIQAPEKQENIVTFLTTDEISKIGNSALTPKVKAIFLFSCFTGLRYSDIKNLKWGNITDDFRLSFSQQKTQTKNGKQTGVTYLPMNPQAIALLGERKPDDYKVFDVPTQQACDKALKNIGTKLKLKKTLHFHIARHSFGVILLENGVDIYKVSKLLGHKSVQTTIKHYANITDKGAREAIDCFPEIKI
ncbi:site-specific integrase [Parabacteroides sp. FAFU027]|uniref:site-specific integrase n=1 Tax=Parabacteroides sp. FAFU027 TaxID=2922715 RepID=UPI001FAFF9CD|nr:site-specific integrase [Parabacteroides sp. FAFU027]